MTMIPTEITPTVASELTTISYLLGGGMALLILKEVFGYLKTLKRPGNGNAGGPNAMEVAVSHALQSATLLRLENSATAQVSALVEITRVLATMNA